MSLFFPRVIKLGGSLLLNPAWPERLREWLARQASPGGVLLVGGGAIADEVRQWDRVHGLGARAAHWLAIRTMGLNGRLAQQLLPEGEWVDSWPELHAIDCRRRLIVLDPLNFLQHFEAGLAGCRLPESWDATSDSIAARVAVALGCDELALIKSCSPPQGEVQDLELLASNGFVDRCFPNVAGGIPLIRFVNFTGEEAPENRRERLCSDFRDR